MKPKYVGVNYLNKLESHGEPKTYHYLNDFNLNVKIHDILLVETNYGVTLAKVVSLVDESDVTPNRHVLDVLTNKSNTLKKISNKARKVELKKEMENAMKQADERLKFKMYADVDPKFAKLLEEFNKLDEME